MRSPRAGPTSPLDALIVTNFTIVGYSETTKPSIVDQSLDYAHLPLGGELEVESRTGAVALASRWLLGWAFASPASIRFGLALFPVPAHRTGQAALPHPALGKDTRLLGRLRKHVTPSATPEHILGWLDSSSIPMSFVASCVRL
jgi:hypothetical protein